MNTISKPHPEAIDFGHWLWTLQSRIKNGGRFTSRPRAPTLSLSTLPASHALENSSGQMLQLLRFHDSQNDFLEILACLGASSHDFGESWWVTEIFGFWSPGDARAHRRRLVQGHEQGQIEISPVRTGTLTLEGLVLPTVEETILRHCLEHHLSPLVDKTFLSPPFFIRDC